MTDMRKYACTKLNEFMPGNGIIIEHSLYNSVQQIQLELHNEVGFDFYNFRREYKKQLQSILLNIQLNLCQFDEDVNKMCEKIHLSKGDSRVFNTNIWPMHTIDSVEEIKELEDGMFRCGKCKSLKTTYTELQTRSADEPTSIFATCLSCGNKWKMNG